MNKKRILAIVFFTFLFGFTEGQNINELLDDLSKKYDFSFAELKTDTFFVQKFILNVNQPIDHKSPRKGSFEQRVILSHYNFESPMVFITEGYGAYYATNPRYVNELSDILKANQVCVEHRYFGESVPETLEWEYLTISYAASDHHRIVEILKEIYKGKWINTGISKGGQTAMYHRYFYPEDVDATVAYVCPLNFSIEDKRVYQFLENVSDSISRSRIFDFQYEMLKNKSLYLPEFKTMVQDRNLTYPIDLSLAYELTVLEYSFAYWQWSQIPIDSIPEQTSTALEMVQHLHKVAGIDWISNEGIKRLQAFFYQALNEIGFYGYDISPFKGIVSFKKNPVFDFTAPDGMKVDYNPVPMQRIDQFIRHQASNMIFIYGENDPWSSTAVDLTYNNNLLKIVKPGGSHSTRLKNLSEKDFNNVMQTLNGWLDH